MQIRWLPATAAALALLCLSPAFSEASPYQVQKGDTLWDLSTRFWDDPFGWPEMWALNPHIHNPHWIFPGQVFDIPTDVSMSEIKDARARAGAPGASSGSCDVAPLKP